MGKDSKVVRELGVAEDGDVCVVKLLRARVQVT